MDQEKADTNKANALPMKRLGPYRLIRLLGEGGMSRVFEATQENPERTVAIKMMREASFSDTALRRFEYEGRILAGLQHPGIAGVFEVGTHRGKSGAIPYLVMEHIPSALPITEYAKNESLSLRERIELFMQVCEVVHYGHRKGVIHRDLKPANIVIDDEGRVKVIDFGVARTTDPDESPADESTTISRVVGTLQYMSPEQCEADPGRLDIRSDVYALGVVLFELLTGEKPYDLKSLGFMESARIIRSESPRKPSGLDDSLKGDVETIVLKALEKERRLRYQTVLELQHDLGRFLNGEVILAKPASPFTRIVKYIKRNPVLSATTATAVVAMACWFAYIIFWALPTLQRERDAARIERNRALQVTRQVEEQLNRIHRLSDSALLGDLKTREQQLWPALPDKVTALESWLSDAETLSTRLDLYEQTLVVWQARALPYDDEAKLAYRQNHPLHKRLLDSQSEKERLSKIIEADAGAAAEALAKLTQRQAELTAQIAEMEIELSSKRPWDFEELADRWQYDQLETLAMEIKDLNREETGLVADIRARLDVAKTIEHDSLIAHAGTWKQVIASIADSTECPRYNGLRIAPQIGFVPLGRDPDSGLWEFFLLNTGSMPARDEEGRLILAEDCGLVFALIPGGSLKLGSNPSDIDSFGMQTLHYESDEEKGAGKNRATPARTVSLSAFFLSKYEMTQAQWLRATRQNPSGYPPGERFGTLHTLLYPVENVAWHECEKTLYRMNLRLPTEAEWEYAARAGTSTPWCMGAKKETLGNAANLCDSNRKKRLPDYQDIYEKWLDDGYIYSAPVGCYRPNPFGLHDIHGNVSEWCQDLYDTGAEADAGAAGKTDEGESTRRGEAADANPGAAEVEKDIKVCRGGGHNSSARDCRLSTRLSRDPDSRRNDCGLRPACSLILIDQRLEP